MKPWDTAFAVTVSICAGIAPAALAVVAEAALEREGLATSVLATVACLGIAVLTFLHLRRILQRAAS